MYIKSDKLCLLYDYIRHIKAKLDGKGDKEIFSTKGKKEIQKLINEIRIKVINYIVKG